MESMKREYSKYFQLFATPLYVNSMINTVLLPLRSNATRREQLRLLVLSCHQRTKIVLDFLLQIHFQERFPVAMQVVEQKGGMLLEVAVNNRKGRCIIFNSNSIDMKNSRIQTKKLKIIDLFYLKKPYGTIS